MLRGAIGILVVLTAGVVLAPMTTSSAHAGGKCDVLNISGDITIEKEAVNPAIAPDPDTGFTPGATQCLFTTELNGNAANVETPCTTDGGDYWSNNQQCYVSLVDPQPPKSPGGDKAGAWYNCNPHPECGAGGRDCFGATFWSATPPPGITMLSPGQAAEILIRSFQLQGVDIGFAPDPDLPDSQSYVGIPIWMWVKNQTPLSYGPYVETATLGGITITATAKVTSILWNMGDGHTVACGDPGRPFKVEYGFIDSPTCGYRYSRMSIRMPDGRYPVTATSQWEVRWTGGGQDGVSRLTTTSETSVEIGELQSVNVTPLTRP